MPDQDYTAAYNHTDRSDIVAVSDVPPFIANGSNSVVHPNPDLHWHYEDGYAYSHSHQHADRDPITHHHSGGVGTGTDPGQANDRDPAEHR